jgi:hypothetical protein
MAAFNANADPILERLNQRFDRLENKLDRDFVWLTGVMIAGFITTLATLIALRG